MELLEVKRLRTVSQSASTAMKWFALVLLLIQTGWISPCIFDKVEELKSNLFKEIAVNSINECFAACYEDVRCIGIQHFKNSKTCGVLYAGNTLHTTVDDGRAVVYSLLRDDVDPTCQTFVNV